MRVKTNAKEVVSFLQKYRQEVKRKLEGMVINFSYNVSVGAVDITPFNSDSEKFAGLYKLRYSITGMHPLPGKAKGGWVMTMNKPFSAHRYGSFARDEFAGNIKDQLDFDSESYKLGDTVYIQNNVPYVLTDNWFRPGMKSLENGYSKQAPNGIIGPVMQLANVLKQDLKRMYDQS